MAKYYSKIKNITDDTERAFYNAKHTHFKNCKTKGPKDGESAFKECRDIIIEKCLLDLRYPIWHAHKFNLINSYLTKNCRAPLWYSQNGNIEECNIKGVKTLRECKNITMSNNKINSTEFGWRCQNIISDNDTLTSEYAFFESKNITISNMNFKGKYSFQYVKNMVIENSNFDTKDAFWHTNNVHVKNSYIKGEYLAWYSNNLTLENCIIEGTQPLCYCKNLKLINCKMINCDLAFEYSDVNATINGSVDSIKNPSKGNIIVDDCKELIMSHSTRPLECKVTIKNK